MGEALRSATIEQLRARIRSMQATGLGARTLPTHAAVAPLLPGNALKPGAVYAVSGSLALTMLLLAGPSAAGGWCAVVGVPEFGIEAAAGFGIALDRLVLVPAPGEHWLAVTAQIAEVVPMLLLRPPPSGASPAETNRLASRLRQRGATLVVSGAWGGAEAALAVDGERWSGIGPGGGYLTGCELDVVVTAREGPVRHRVEVTDGFRTAPAAVVPAPVVPIPVVPVLSAVR